MNNAGHIGVIYNVRTRDAKELAGSIAQNLGKKAIVLATDEAQETLSSCCLSLIIAIGGDGTILRVAAFAAPLAIPILGVNMGHLGFMTELQADQALVELPNYLNGESWIEERTMLQAKVVSDMRSRNQTIVSVHHGLNEAVVGRDSLARVNRIQTKLDNRDLTTYNADAVIVATATGSTGYALSAGGPVLYPQSHDLVLVAVAPHLGLPASLVLPSSAAMEIMPLGHDSSMLTIDGCLDIPVGVGDVVIITRSPYKTRFVRRPSGDQFFQMLTRRLGRTEYGQA